MILIKNCPSAADGLSLGIARTRHELIVCLHQDVRLPPGWDQRLIQQLDAVTRQWGPIGVAGVYDPRKRIWVLGSMPNRRAGAADGEPQPQPL